MKTVVCIDNDIYESKVFLTKGKRYKVISEILNTIEILDDRNISTCYYHKRFVDVSYFRKHKLQRILK